MKKFLALILSVCFYTAVFAQGVHLYKNGARITVNSNEVDSLVYFPGQEEGQSLFEYIDQAVKNAVEANQNIWEIGYDGYWYKNGIQTEYRAVGRDGMNGMDGRDGYTPGISFQIDDSGHLIAYIDGVAMDLGNVRGQDGLNGRDGADGKNGQDGHTPSVSFEIDSNGHLIVTIDGISTDLGRVLGDNQHTDDQDPLNPDSFINGHEYVDLGVKNAQGKTIYWAKCNVGATKPYEYGDYFAWGETEPKSKYTEETYLYGNMSIGDDIGGTQYDAARQNWGGSWRMPTLDELVLLIQQCDWTWTDMRDSDGNSIFGYKVSNRSDNSKFIFLPAAGCRSDTSLQTCGSRGYYWSSTLAYKLDFSSGNIGPLNVQFRILGLSVRPVTE